MVVVISFWQDGYLEIIRETTWANYTEVWTNPAYRLFMLRSLKIAFITTVIVVLLAYPIAYYISFVAAPNRKAFWIFVITIPFWTSYLMRIFLWRTILAYNGPINGTLVELEVIAEPLSWILYNQTAIVITLAHSWMPFAVLPMFVAMERIDRSLTEAATDLGDPPFWRFWRVTLPLSMPGVVAATLIVFVPTIGDYVTPALVGGTGDLMIANAIELQFKRLDNQPLGAAIALSAMFIVTCIALAYLALNRRFLGGRTA